MHGRDGMPTLVTLGHGYSAAALAASLAGWRVVGHHPVGAEGGGDARRPASSRSTGPTARRSTGRSPRPTPCWCRCPRTPTATRCWRATRTRSPARRRPGSAICRRPGSTATGRAAGSTRRAPSIRQASAAAAGSRRRPPGAPPGCRCTLFRLAGIYGPGRSILDRLRAGRAQRVVKPGQVFSRIHVADVAQVLAASLARPNPGAPTTSPTTCRRRPRRSSTMPAGCSGCRCRRRCRSRRRTCHADGGELLGRVEAGLATGGSRPSFGSPRLSGLSGRPRGGARGGRVSHSVAENCPDEREIAAGVRGSLVPCMVQSRRNGPNGRTR